MIDHLVVQTNLYATQFFDKEKDNLKPHSRVHEWKPTDRAEMLTLLAILILMGIVHKPRLPNVLVYRQHFGNANLQSSYEEGQISSTCQIFPL